VPTLIDRAQIKVTRLVATPQLGHSVIDRLRGSDMLYLLGFFSADTRRSRVAIVTGASRAIRARHRLRAGQVSGPTSLSGSPAGSRRWSRVAPDVLAHGRQALALACDVVDARVTEALAQDREEVGRSSCSHNSGYRIRAPLEDLPLRMGRQLGARRHPHKASIASRRPRARDDPGSGGRTSFQLGGRRTGRGIVCACYCLRPMQAVTVLTQSLARNGPARITQPVAPGPL